MIPAFFMKIPIQKILVSVAGVLAVCTVAIWMAVFTENQRNNLTVAFLDIGQGDSIFIEAPNGNQILVDAGPNAKVLQELGGVMPWYDKSLDMIVVTNPDKDHIAGFVDVLKRFDVQYVLEPGTENKTLINTTLHELMSQKNVEKGIARRGMEIVLDKKRNIILTILFPDSDVSKLKSNDGSIVMRLTYGETEVMLTGDAPTSVEKHILSLDNSDPQFGLQSDILKIGHHGSKTSTSKEFVTAVKPAYAVISSGKGNKYGHPTPETLATLGTFPLQVLRTDELGTIIMKSDGKSFALNP